MHVGREQILAFRLSSHNLTRRLARESLIRAAAACGIQETPSASTEVAFLARVDGLSPAALEGATTKDRTLVTIWSVRGAPYVVPVDDLAAFTVGALPVDGNSFGVFLGGWAAPLQEAGLDPSKTLERMIAVAKTLLDGKTMNVNELRDRIFARVRSLSRVRRPQFARADMPEPLFRALGTAGAVCIVSGRGTDAEVARSDQWLRTEPPGPDPTGARAELARRFLHCYGPATARHFAEWTQRDTADAKEALSQIEGELEEVSVDGNKALLLRRDMMGLASPPEPRGVRLLPLQDPYLQQRDRATLVPDAMARRKLWQPVRGPGGVILDGEVVGTWRARSRGARLEAVVEPFSRLPGGAREPIVAELERIGTFRAFRSAEVRFGE